MNHPRATGPSFGDEEPFIYKKGPAFGMPGVLVDGMDVRKARPGLCQVGFGVGDKEASKEGPRLCHIWHAGGRIERAQGALTPPSPRVWRVRVFI